MMQMQGYGYGYGAPPSMRQETTFLAESGVQVTSARFSVGQQMYPIAALTSVSPFTIPARRGGAIALVAALGCFLLFAVISLTNYPSGGLFAIVAVTIGLIALNVLWIRSLKDLHGVMVSTSGMQQRALATTDLPFVHRVVGALHQAIASR